MIELIAVNVVLGLLRAGIEGLAIGAGIGLMLRSKAKAKR